MRMLAHWYNLWVCAASAHFVWFTCQMRISIFSVLLCFINDIQTCISHVSESHASLMPCVNIAGWWWWCDGVGCVFMAYIGPLDKSGGTFGNDVQISCGIQTLLQFYQGAQCVPWKHTPHDHTSTTTTTSLQCWHMAWWMHLLMWFSPHPSPPISMKQQEPGFIRPGNVFLILHCPVFSFLRQL